MNTNRLYEMKVLFWSQLAGCLHHLICTFARYTTYFKTQPTCSQQTVLKHHLRRGCWHILTKYIADNCLGLINKKTRAKTKVRRKHTHHISSCLTPRAADSPDSWRFSALVCAPVMLPICQTTRTSCSVARPARLRRGRASSATLRRHAAGTHEVGDSACLAACAAR